MKMLRRVAFIAFVLAIASLVKPDFLKWHRITPVYAAKSCQYGTEIVPSGQCDQSTGQGYCFDGGWYVPQYSLLPDGSTAPGCSN